MKEIGVGMAARLMAKGIKPRLVISEEAGQWTVRSESSVKSSSYQFTPNVEFDETTADGREVKVDRSSFPDRLFLYLTSPVDHQLSRRQMGSHIDR